MTSHDSQSKWTVVRDLVMRIFVKRGLFVLLRHLQEELNSHPLLSVILAHAFLPISNCSIVRLFSCLSGAARGAHVFLTKRALACRTLLHFTLLCFIFITTDAAAVLQLTTVECVISMIYMSTPGARDDFLSLIYMMMSFPATVRMVVVSRHIMHCLHTALHQCLNCS
jgi:hypothetical protein